jgi:hypothetical protein
LYLRQHGNMVYFGGRERSVVTIVDVPHWFCWSITKACRTLFFEKISFPPLAVRWKTSIAPDDMVQEPAPVNYREPIFEPVLSFQPTFISWRISI